MAPALLWLACGGTSTPTYPPSVNLSRCGPNSIIDASGRCTVCPEGHAPSGTHCVRGLAAIETADGPLAISTLGGAWHPDPDDDGVASADDLCPHFYDPRQQDRDGDKIGDACDRDDGPSQEGARIVLRIEHVTPYGAWFSFISPRSSEYAWKAGIAWSNKRQDLISRDGIAGLIAAGAVHKLDVTADFGFSTDPIVVTSLDPGTVYYAAPFRRDFKDRVFDIGEVIEFETAAEPKLNVTRPHPRILVTERDITALKARYQSGDVDYKRWHELLSTAVKNAAAPGSGVYLARSYCTAAALLYRVTGDMDFRAAAATLLARSLKYIERTELATDAYASEGAALAMCLDVLGNDVDAPTRARAVTAYLKDDARNLDSGSQLAATATYAATTETLLMNSILACGADDLPAQLREQGCRNLDAAQRRWFGVQLVQARRAQGMYAHSGGYLPEGVDGG
ncbi:MAG: hypothetical protein AAGC55_15205, partial [Myxococcota bacterium]